MLFKKIADKLNIHWQVLLTLKSWSSVQIYSFVIESQKTIFAENLTPEVNVVWYVI